MNTISNRLIIPLLAALSLSVTAVHGETNIVNTPKQASPNGTQTETSDISLLLKPESPWIHQVSSPDAVTLLPRVEGTNALSFSSPEILVHKNTDQAEFISAVWKDAAGKVVHQRSVFVVKPDYALLVDHLFTPGQNTVIRSFAFPSTQATFDKGGGQITSVSGTNFRVQAIDVVGSKTDSSDSGKAVMFTTSIRTPAPIATLLLNWSGSSAPKAEFIKPSNPLVVKCKVTFPDGHTDYAALAWVASPLHLEGKELRGWAACLRKSPSGTTTIEIK